MAVLSTSSIPRCHRFACTPAFAPPGARFCLIITDWFEGLNVKTKVANPTYLESVNTYGVHCGGDLHMWESNGWIKECDPYGWFQVGWEINLSHNQ